jgi:hypothetical protein
MHYCSEIPNLGKTLKSYRVVECYCIMIGHRDSTLLIKRHLRAIRVWKKLVHSMTTLALPLNLQIVDLLHNPKVN